VAEYRAFSVGADGHFVGFEPIVCDTDDEAVERAKRLLDGRDVEVWCAERLVVRLTAKETPQSSE
jgi:alkanesulfonate monooxygenase SsuD/methylene tetrahydromethanopterin reductase-like flavin-dependent oxidoreductase (luciferase family)